MEGTNQVAPADNEAMGQPQPMAMAPQGGPPAKEGRAELQGEELGDGVGI